MHPIYPSSTRNCIYANLPSILEEKIFEHPADESRAPELWRNSAKWLKYEKLMYGHQDAVNDLRKYLVELDGDLSDEGQWLKEAPADFKRLENLIEEDLVKRTNNLSELVCIRKADMMIVANK